MCGQLKGGDEVTAKGQQDGCLLAQNATCTFREEGVTVSLGTALWAQMLGRAGSLLSWGGAALQGQVGTE